MPGISSEVMVIAPPHKPELPKMNDADCISNEKNRGVSLSIIEVSLVHFQ